MANWSGITASISAVLRPRILEPRLTVSSISQLDFQKFKHRGVIGVVIDKDNCLTKPHQDDLAPSESLRESWFELLEIFGQDNILIVSNSVGTLSKDSALLGAETVSRNLKVPVLVHSQPKPGQKCVEQIANHFNQLPQPSSSQIVYSPLAQSRRTRTRRSLPPTVVETEDTPLKILVIGDRLATDLILSHRLNNFSLPPPTIPSSSRSILSRLLPTRSNSPDSPSPTSRRRRIETIGILTTGLHEKESIGTTLLRGIEKLALKRLNRKRRNLGINEGRHGGGWKGEKWEECLKDYHELEQTRIEELQSTPKTATTTAAAAAVAGTSSTLTKTITKRNPRPSSFSTLSPKIFALTSSFFALSHTLPNFFFVRLPKKIVKTLQSLPLTTYSFVKKILNKGVDKLLENLPNIASKLYGPLERFTKIYSSNRATTIERLSGIDGKGNDMITQSEGRIDRVFDRFDQVFRQAKETVARREKVKSS